MRFIHYGSSKFNPNRFIKVKNSHWVKPFDGGLWASPKDSEYGWRDWCIDNDYGVEKLKRSFEFEIREDSKILNLRSMKEIREASDKGFLYLAYPNRDDLFYLDFELIVKNYDAIYYECNNETYFPLYGWDCDSLLVLNKNIIIV